METEGPFMKRDVKGSVTGPTSVSMSPPSFVILSVTHMSLFPFLTRLISTRLRNGGKERP